MSIRHVALVVLAALATAASAQGYPEKPLTLIVPYAFGAPADGVARVAASDLEANLDRPIEVVNRPGAAALSALDEVSGAPADGYTLLAIGAPMAAAPGFRPKDFSGVGQVVFSDYVLVAHRSTAARSVQELVALIKAEPGRYRFASDGEGTLAHLAAELFARQAAFEAEHVPYKDLWQAATEVAAGRAQFMFMPWPAAINRVKSGALRVLAVPGPRRLGVFKDAPTMAEAGFPGFVVRDWLGFVVRAGTPRPVIARLNRELNRALAEPGVREQLGQMGAELSTGTPRALDELIAAEAKRWEKFNQKR